MQECHSQSAISDKKTAKISKASGDTPLEPPDVPAISSSQEKNSPPKKLKKLKKTIPPRQPNPLGEENSSFSFDPSLPPVPGYPPGYIGQSPDGSMIVLPPLQPPPNVDHSSYISHLNTLYGKYYGAYIKHIKQQQAYMSKAQYSGESSD